MKLILWAETKQPAKVPRDVLSHHDSPLSTSVSRASDPQLYSSSLQPRTHILCAVAWKTYCGVIQLDSRNCSIAQSSVSKAIVKTQPRIKASSAWLKMVDFLIAVAGLCT